MKKFLQAKRYALNAQSKGFTIIEMIVTVGVGSIFLFAAYQLMLGAIRSSSESRNRTTAANLLTKKVEEIRGLSYSSIPACPNDPPAIPPDPATCTETVTWPPTTGIVYTITIFSDETVYTFPSPSTDTSERKDIRVTIKWNDPKAKTLRSEISITPDTANRTPQ